MGPDTQVIWNEEPGRNVDHVAEHGLTPAEVDEVLCDPDIPVAQSDSSGSPCKFGETSTGKYIIVVWEQVYDDPRIVLPVTAFEVPRPRARRAGKRR